MAILKIRTTNYLEVFIFHQTSTLNINRVFKINSTFTNCTPRV